MPFGSALPGRSFGSSAYRYSFNGKEKDKDGTGQSVQYDYGFRIYDPHLGRFKSVDPLTKNYPFYSPYHFAGNNPVAMVDIDGREPATINPETEMLVLILQGVGSDPKDGATQATNAAKTNKGLGPDRALGSIRSTSPKLQIVVYASSRTDNTKNDVAVSIATFLKQNPNGKIVAIGHSQGADNLVELAEQYKNVPKLNMLLITLDSKDARIFSKENNDIPSNVSNAINYYQRGEFFNGEKMHFAEGVNGANILSPGSNHRSIDDNLIPYIVDDINNFYQGKDAVKIAKERKLPTFIPNKDQPNISEDIKKKSGSK